MLGTVRRMRKHRLATCDVVREAAAGQNDTAIGMNANQPSLAFDHGAGHRAVLDDQFADRRRQPQRYVQVEGGFREPPGERVAIGQRHAAAVTHHVHRLAGQALGDKQRRRQRFRRAHEVNDLLAGAQHHAEHGEFGQGAAEVLDVRPSSRPQTAASPSSVRLARRPALRRGNPERSAACRTAARFRSEEVDRLRPFGQKCIDARGVKSCCRPRGADRFLPARAPPRCPSLGERGTGNPQPAAGTRGGAAKARLLLDDRTSSP